MGSPSNATTEEILAVFASKLLSINVVPKAMIKNLKYVSNLTGVEINNADSLVYVDGSVDIGKIYETSLRYAACGDNSDVDLSIIEDIKKETPIANNSKSNSEPTDGKNSFVIFVKMLKGDVMPIEVWPTMLIEDLKQLIFKESGMHVDRQRLIFTSQMEDGRTLSNYNLGMGCTIHLASTLMGGGPGPFYTLNDDLLDPAFDYDFRKINDSGKVFSRGGTIYVRPCGWKRHAIKVLDQYESNKWLGQLGEDRTESCPDEWPVSYHGTSLSNGMSIAEKGYLLSKGQRFRFGYGIYSTPNLSIAEAYAAEFAWRGSTYKILIQNRVHPERINKIRFADGTEYWISPEQTDIRMYGLLIKKTDEKRCRFM